jgi:hypothetical protein
MQQSSGFYGFDSERSYKVVMKAAEVGLLFLADMDFSLAREVH